MDLSGIGLVVVSTLSTGVLGVVWNDIRVSRTKQEKDKQEYYKVFITEKEHILMCKNTVLGLEKVMSESLKNLQESIMIELKNISSSINKDN